MIGRMAATDVSVQKKLKSEGGVRGLEARIYIFLRAQYGGEWISDMQIY